MVTNVHDFCTRFAFGILDESYRRRALEMRISLHYPDIPRADVSLG